MTTTQNRYAQIIFMSGDEAIETLDLLNDKGEDFIIEYLADNFESDDSLREPFSILGAGTSDTIYQKGDYFLIYNQRLGYVALEKLLSSDWNAVSQISPPKNIIIQTKIDDTQGVRNEARLQFDGKLWWLPDRSMYVYYTPTHWRSA